MPVVLLAELFRRQPDDEEAPIPRPRGGVRFVRRFVLLLHLKPEPTHNLDDRLPLSRDFGPAFRECENVYDRKTKETAWSCSADDPRRHDLIDPILGPLCASDAVKSILHPSHDPPEQVVCTGSMNSLVPVTNQSEMWG